MKVKFKNGTVEYNCNEPVEQKLFANGKATGWVIIFTVLEELNSKEVDAALTDDAISEITFTKNDGTSIVIEGYQRVASCSVRHRESNATSVEIQLAKGV